MQTSLYDRLGGKESIAAVVDDFVGRTLLGSELGDQQKQDASIDLARIAIDRFR